LCNVKSRALPPILPLRRLSGTPDAVKGRMNREKKTEGAKLVANQKTCLRVKWPHDNNLSRPNTTKSKFVERALDSV
jgi:hypothetical protein